MAYEGSGGYGTLPFANERYIAVLTVKSGPDPHGLEFRLQGEWLMVIMMSSFKRGARMRVGGRIGRLDKTRLPTPTPPSPPPQEWEDLNDTEEEDLEELVPNSSDEEQSKSPKCRRKCHCCSGRPSRSSRSRRRTSPTTTKRE
ncbi:hypothetical protein U9M48_000715 [Paspalum notatum var. saurae]|uniref:Uncharacterized protein n=1 Tax=Paspalum notatum var. saurae TaxID=547442 RepID=A0AAQ3PKM2_PASNO